MAPQCGTVWSCKRGRTYCKRVGYRGRAGAKDNSDSTRAMKMDEDSCIQLAGLQRYNLHGRISRALPELLLQRDVGAIEQSTAAIGASSPDFLKNHLHRGETRGATDRACRPRDVCRQRRLHRRRGPYGPLSQEYPGPGSESHSDRYRGPGIDSAADPQSC